MPALLTEGLLKPHPFLENCSDTFLNYLEQFSQEVTFTAGQIIFREGSYADKFYLLIDGRVVLEAGCNGGPATTIQVLSPGELLGWSWLFPPFEYHFNARALEAGSAIEINGASLLIRAQENPEFGFELLSRVSQEVIKRIQATRRKLTEQMRIRRKVENAMNLPH